MDGCLPTRLTDGIQSLPNLDKFVISNPTSVTMLPHPTLIRYLEIHSLPPDCEDWVWLQQALNLQNIDIIFAKSSAEIEEDAISEEFHLHDTHVDLMKVSGPSLKILENVPERAKVSKQCSQ